MEKLIELLNEYEYSMFEDKSLATQRGNIQDRIVFEKDFCKDLNKARDLTMNVTHLISHRYGFIKWLVDNDKIDRLTFCTVETPSSKYEDFDLGPETSREDYTNILLMDLAIQEKPIEFLISILR